MNNLLKEHVNSDPTFLMNKKGFIFPASIIVLLIIAASCRWQGEKDFLKSGFLNPPDTARPGVYWYFMDGNISRQGITEDLEAMKRAGISYAIFLEVNVGIPSGTVKFMSDEWIDLFAHAVREAERLGINIILGSGPGWAGSGGPWVTPEESMMHLVSSDTLLTGPAVFNARLPVPKPKKPFFGESALTPLLKEKRDNWYEDVRLLAFPAPDSGKLIRNLEEKAFYYRPPYTSQPGTAPFLAADTSEYPALNKSAVRKDKITDLTMLPGRDGTLTWNVPPGRWIVARFGKRNNGAVTRPAPEPGLGFESDKFDTAALGSHYRQYTGRLLAKVKPSPATSKGGWKMLHIDSWEMGAQNWSSRFMDEFIKRRGYDPVLYLPVIAGYIVNSADESERFLWDLRQTASELIIENHAGYFKQLGSRNGFTLSIEPYDMNPASDFDLGAVADIPMGEFWTSGHGFNSSFSCIEAVSIGHVTGRRIIAAEAFTADNTEAWRMYPGNMKNQTDWALAMGINRFFFHTFAHKPHDQNLKPGMTMGPYGVHWDRGQTWWELSSGYHTYLARCQFMLMQGAPVADILYLTTEGAPAVFVPPSSSLEGTDTLPDKRGYSFDVCSPSYFIKNATVVNNKILFPSGASYSILVLPESRTMTPELLEKIDFMLKTGAYIAGYMPVSSPSLTGYPECDAKVRSMAETIWGINWSQGRSRVKYLNGTLFKMDEYSSSGKDQLNIKKRGPYDLYPEYDTIASLLKGAGVDPDFSCQGGEIRYHHRKLPGKEIYFISNRSGRTITDTCRFRDGTAWGELWDPLTGKIRELKNITTTGRAALLPVVLEPYAAYFIVFHKKEAVSVIKSGSGNDFQPKDTLQEIKGPWEMYFDPNAGGPGRIVSDTLFDWSRSAMEGIKYYSGKVICSNKFTMPGDILKNKGMKFHISAIPVNGMAKISVNGKTAGIVWTYPYEIEITPYLKAGENKLEIEVVNLWINRLIGDENMPWDGIEDGRFPEWYLNKTGRPEGRISFTTHRYWKKDDRLIPSGLSRPVRILASGTH